MAKEGLGDQFWNLVTGGLPQLAFSLWQSYLTSEQQKKYDAAVEVQIAEGRSMAEATQQVALDMVSKDPDSKHARALLSDLRRRLPSNAYNEIKTITNLSKRQREDFLEDYDSRTGAYLDQLSQSQGLTLDSLNRANSGIGDDYAKREADMMGLLEGQGTQALDDIERSYSESTEASLGDLSSRGLSGSTVGSSIRSGNAQRRGEDQARVRESVAAQKANALAGLRGDTLAFRERGANLGAGFADANTARWLGAKSGAESGRAAYNAAMSGQTLDRRENALNRAYGLDRDLNLGYADYLQGRGDTRLNTYLDQRQYLQDFLNYGVQNAPPNPEGSYQMMYNAGQGVAQ